MVTADRQAGPTYQSQVSLSIYKICLAGKFGVGKTEIFKILSNRKADKSIGFDSFEYKVDGFPAKIIVSDTAGLEQHGGSLTKSNYYRGAHVIVMVYDMTDTESLHYLDNEMKALQENVWIDEATRLILVRNKTDMTSHVAVSKEYENDFIENRRTECLKNLVHVIETSTKTSHGEKVVKKLFYQDMLGVLKGQEPIVKKDMNWDRSPPFSHSSCSSCWS